MGMPGERPPWVWIAHSHWSATSDSVMNHAWDETPRKETRSGLDKTRTSLNYCCGFLCRSSG